MRLRGLIVPLSAVIGFSMPIAGQQVADTSAHTVQFVRVEPDVSLEVLDWGGSGQSLVLLAGRGNTAHVYDNLAVKLSSDFHVYGITRRGFGNSTYTAEGFIADRLGDDVLAVLDSLAIHRPVIIGHSVAGSELSSIGSRYPERVAGLVYLDAVFHFAFYDPSLGRAPVFFRDTQRKLAQLTDLSLGMTLSERGALIQELLDRLPTLERDLLSYLEEIAAVPDQSLVVPQPDPNPVHRALADGQQTYTSIEVPVLAVVAHPPEYPPAAVDAAARARYDSIAEARLSPRINAFQRGVPSARVVRIPHANHYVFRSHEEEVLQEIRDFVEELASVVAVPDAIAGCDRDPQAILYLVNGSPATCGAVLAIPRDRIASIDVLKGTSAAQRYPEAAGRSVVEVRIKAGS